MALSKAFTFNGSGQVSGDGWSFNQSEQTVNLGDCYIKVETVSGTKDQQLAAISIKAKNGAIKREQRSFAPNLNGENFIKQAYEHLKTLPEFAGAVDC